MQHFLVQFSNGDILTDLIHFAEKLKIKYSKNEPMKNHTTFKVGGNAALMVFPASENEAAEIIKFCSQQGIRLIAIGNGSNLLVSDNGIEACVMCFGNDFSEIRLIDDETIFAQSGTSLMKLCRFALEHSLSGLEFAYGIPGSCGGAAFMNAGAYGGEMKDVLYKCIHIDKNGNPGSLEGNEMKLSYRHSVYYDNGCVITGIYLKLKKGSKEDIKAKMDDFLQRRKDKQPLEYPSAGSTFKRPEGYFAGALIEECGLKGRTVGGAQISEKHAGFVINKGNATCSDILQLCNICSETVMNEKGVKLEMEIRVTE